MNFDVAIIGGGPAGGACASPDSNDFLVNPYGNLDRARSGRGASDIKRRAGRM